MKIAMIIGVLLWVGAFAEVDYDNTISKYKNTPTNVKEEVYWEDPYDNTYLPYNVCNDILNFEFSKLEERVDYYYDNKDDFLDLRHYYALVSIVRITYNVTCLNKLQYKGVYHLFSEPRKIDGSILQNDDVIDRFKAHAHEWQNKPIAYLSEEGVFYDEDTDYRFDDYTIFPKSALKESWKKQKVTYPDWIYKGVPGEKSPRPVLFIHGLGSDYEVWGVESTVNKEGGKNKGDERFQKGLVKKYERGSTPDILARTLNIDNSEGNINKNGIYFFQAPGSIVDGKWEEAKPHWILEDPQKSQSRKLYDKLVEVMDDFYKSENIDWTITEDTPIDIVAHSQGGLVIREMLRGLFNTNDESIGIGTANAANHIGKVITVDTPHFGSELAVVNSTDIEKNFPGLKRIIDDLDAQSAGTPNEHTLVSATLDMAWYEYASITAGMGFDLMSDITYNGTPVFIDGPQAILNPVLSPALGILGWTFGAAISPFTDITLTVKGPYIGTYDVEIFVDIPGPFNKTIKMEIDALENISKEAQQVRNGAKHLDNKDDFMTNLAKSFNGNAYPLKPNGTKLTLLPLYSPSTKIFLAELIHSIVENANRICVDEDESEECFAVSLFFEQTAIQMAAKKGFTISKVEDFEINSELWNALVDIQDTWFDQSDALVTEYSQKFIEPNLGLSTDNEELLGFFKEPRSYLFHDALAPWEDVLHGPYGNLNDGATKQGLDIACALDFYCDNLISKDESKLIYLTEGSVSLMGDFNVSTIFLEKGSQIVQVSDGTNDLKAEYKPGVGSSVFYTDQNGNVQTERILDKSIATSPMISRKNNVFTVSFNNYSGKTYSKDYTLNSFSDVVNFSIISEENGPLPEVIAGTAAVTNPSTQVPPKIPVHKFYAKSSVFVYHREARGEWEMNTSRPRFLIANASEEDVVGFKIAYYFTADPARNPQVVVDYPNTPVIVEHLGGDQWRFILDLSESKLKAKSVFPNPDGWQIRIHYSDWTDYKHLNDWSADYNIGIPKLNRKIVVYDKKGNILWGTEPEDYSSIEKGIVAAPVGIISWVDSSPLEKNFFKPQVTIKNTGSIPLKNIHAKLWFRIPQGKQLFIPMDDWYTPESTPLLVNMGKNVWELDLYFNRHILYSKDSVVEGNIGLHLTDWSPFDKTVCGIALLDDEGTILYGKAPSVEECKSYDQPNLITTQYAWSF